MARLAVALTALIVLLAPADVAAEHTMVNPPAAWHTDTIHICTNINLGNTRETYNRALAHPKLTDSPHRASVQLAGCRGAEPGRSKATIHIDPTLPDRLWATTRIWIATHPNSSRQITRAAVRLHPDIQQATPACRREILLHEEGHLLGVGHPTHHRTDTVMDTTACQGTYRLTEHTTDQTLRLHRHDWGDHHCRQVGWCRHSPTR